MILHKYNGCGDDFISLDYAEDTDYSQLVASLYTKERYDTDGLTAVKIDPLEMVYYNEDDSRALMYGNGIRCFARCANNQNTMSEQEFNIETLAGTRKIAVLDPSPSYCGVDMGVPDDPPEKIKANQTYPIKNQEIEINGEKVTITSLFLGTIHTVVFVENAREEVWRKRGELICHHPLFKERIDIDFVEVVNEQELIVRTYEGGVGWTLVCGTDCCASYVVAKETGKISVDQIAVHLEQGGLMISGEDTIQMAGSVVHEWTRVLEE